MHVTLVLAFSVSRLSIACRGSPWFDESESDTKITSVYDLQVAVVNEGNCDTIVTLLTCICRRCFQVRASLTMWCLEEIV